MTATRRTAREWAIQMLTAADLNPAEDIRAFMDGFWGQLSDLDEEGGGSAEATGKLKEFAGTSPSDLIKSVRLKQAAYLLVQGNVTVSEVAYSVGFTSPAYFASTFSQHYGMTPKEFMNNYNERPDSPELQQLLER